MRVLVTGASGFIGRHCLQYLSEQDHDVHAVARSPLPLSAATWHTADLLSPGTPSRLIAAVLPEVVLHLAWYTTPMEYWKSAENLRWVQATSEILCAASVAKCKRIVMAGTSAEYDCSSGICSETFTPLRPGSLYAASKQAVFLLLEQFAPLAGMTWCWGRVFNVYGPNEDLRRLVPSLVRSVLEEGGKPVRVVNEQRDFLHVADVARAFVKLVESDFCGSVNIGSGCAVPIREIAEKIASSLRRPVHIHIDASPTPVPKIQAETDILMKNIEWKPHYTLETGLSNVVAWWHDHLNCSGGVWDCRQS